MARLLNFNNMEPGTQTWYQDLDSGAIVQVFPGSQVPVRLVNNPDQYVDQGVAEITGEEDGGDGQVDRVADALRAILISVAPLEGDASFWTLDDMVAQVATIQSNDSAAKAAWIDLEAIVPTVLETSPADGDTEVAVDAAMSVLFSMPIRPTTAIPANFSIRDHAGGASGINVTDVTLDEEFTTATLTLDSELVTDTIYKIRVGTGVTNFALTPLEEPFIQATGFATPDTIAPTVTFTGPNNAAEGVDPAGPFTVSFDKAVDPATVDEESIYLVDENGDPADVATVSVAVFGSSATLTMAGPLTAGAVYKHHVTTAVTDLAGNALAEAYESPDGFTINAE